MFFVSGSMLENLLYVTSPQKQETDVSLVLKDGDTDSENLSSLIRFSVSDSQKTDSSKDVSFIGIYFFFHFYLGVTLVFAFYARIIPSNQRDVGVITVCICIGVQLLWEIIFEIKTCCQKDCECYF